MKISRLSIRYFVLKTTTTILYNITKTLYSYSLIKVEKLNIVNNNFIQTPKLKAKL